MKFTKSVFFNCAVIFTFLIVIVSIAYIYIPWEKFNILDQANENQIKEAYQILPILFSASLVVVTLAIAIIAKNQIDLLTRIENAELMFKIINEYTSKEVIEARTIIHKIYLEAEGIELEKRLYIRNYIRIMSHKKNDSKKYILLLNLLDYLEIICYFANKNTHTENDLDNLIGNSIEFYYDIFRDWIDIRRAKYNKNSFYCEFEKFAKKTRQKSNNR